MSIDTQNGHKIWADPHENEVWFKIQHGGASMYTTLTKDEAQELVNELNKALGLCPKCLGEEWDTIKEEDAKYADCSCGHTWIIES